MVISARQTRHAASIYDTCIAHDSQTRACPHGTTAKPARGATRHTSQQSSDVVAAAAVADSDAPDVVAAGTGACLTVLVLAIVAAVVTPYERRHFHS